MPANTFEDTIAAISTPPGNGGIGIVRISGSGAVSVLSQLYRGHLSPESWPSHTMHYGHIYYKGGLVDEVMASLMRAPRSYTREDVAEINCHGGVRAVSSVLRAVLGCGVRLAHPGEFTMRAFLNGRIDISQAEAVADIINSKTDAALAVAQRQLEGSLSARIRDIIEPISVLVANIEVSIDYPEHDENTLNIPYVTRLCEELIPRLDTLINSFCSGRILREGIPTLILGSPNVGKSSLLNALLGVDRAIVTDIPGTTRDTLSEVLSLGGIPLVVTDTAGIRASDDLVESLGIERSLAQLDVSQLVLLVLDASRGLDYQDKELLLSPKLAGLSVVILLNKCDLGMKIDKESMCKIGSINPLAIIPISMVPNHELFHNGLEHLARCVTKSFGLGDIRPDDAPMLTNHRHEQAVSRARNALEQAAEAATLGMSEDVVVIPLREALGALGELTGESVDEDILDRIFSTFCLGK